jgi:glycosyltransferase involved in cell wall biosynthesis
VVRHGRDGLLVPPRDPVALADALARVLSDRSLAEQLAQAGRGRAERFRWETVVQEVEETYGDALASARDR